MNLGIISPTESGTVLIMHGSAFYNATGREIDNINCQCYHHYMPFGDNPNYKENFKHNVDYLLIFAKPT